MRIVIVAVCLFALASCKAPTSVSIDEFPVIEEPLTVAWPAISGHRYMPNPGGYIKKPLEFNRDGGGDCLDFAANLLYRLGPDASFVSLRIGDSKHAIVKYRGEFLEPQVYKKIYKQNELSIIQELPYSRFMLIWARE